MLSAVFIFYWNWKKPAPALERPRPQTTTITSLDSEIRHNTWTISDFWLQKEEQLQDELIYDTYSSCSGSRGSTWHLCGISSSSCGRWRIVRERAASCDSKYRPHSPYRWCTASHRCTPTDRETDQLSLFLQVLESSESLAQTHTCSLFPRERRYSRSWWLFRNQKTSEKLPFHRAIYTESKRCEISYLCAVSLRNVKQSVP